MMLPARLYADAIATPCPRCYAHAADTVAFIASLRSAALQSAMLLLCMFCLTIVFHAADAIDLRTICRHSAYAAADGDMPLSIDAVFLRDFTLRCFRWLRQLRLDACCYRYVFYHITLCHADAAASAADYAMPLSPPPC